MFVDDEPAVLAALRRMLHGHRSQWNLEFVEDGSLAWERIRRNKPDLVVTDVNMPGMNGIDLLVQIRQEPLTEDVQVIMLTGLADRNIKRRALDLGAADLLNKPVEFEDLLARLRNVLRLKAQSDQLKAHNEILETTVRRRTAELRESRIAIVWRLAKAAEYRDEDTGDHVIRVGYYSRLTAEALGFSQADAENLFLAAPLHDIGKIGIPDAVLRKKGKLDDDDWIIMRQHCLFGKCILEEDPKTARSVLGWQEPQLEPEVKEMNPVLKLAASIAYNHHEKWAGDGYPRGLARDDIPLEARIVAVADVFDALSSSRPYKDALPEEQVLQIMREQANRHFDPQVFEAFLSRLDSVRAVQQELAKTKLHEAGTTHEKHLVCG